MQSKKIKKLRRTRIAGAEIAPAFFCFRRTGWARALNSHPLLTTAFSILL
jgi:hypothetical protein